VFPSLLFLQILNDGIISQRKAKELQLLTKLSFKQSSSSIVSLFVREPVPSVTNQTAAKL
jgi:hypothetical protein